MGYVGRFESDEPIACVRGGRVVVRTSRGIEVGEVLLAAAGDAATIDDQPLAGRMLRLLTREDELLARGLREGEERAFEACRRLLAERQLPVELLDAEQLLDGETLIFYFLGEPTPALADVKQDLAREYESRIEFRQFAERLQAGCGPGCGTDAAPGCTSRDNGCDANDCQTCHNSEPTPNADPRR
jgi:cell fate regulator YaaT (PSP1 superfamily)